MNFSTPPNKVSSNRHHIPPREMHMSLIISQLTNKGQCQTLVTMTQTKLARPTTTTSPIMTQTKLDRPTPITPLQQPTIPYVHQPKL